MFVLDKSPSLMYSPNTFHSISLKKKRTHNVCHGLYFHHFCRNFQILFPIELCWFSWDKTQTSTYLDKSNLWSFLHFHMCFVLPLQTSAYPEMFDGSQKLLSMMVRSVHSPCKLASLCIKLINFLSHHQPLVFVHIKDFHDVVYRKPTGCLRNYRQLAEPSYSASSSNIRKCHYFSHVCSGFCLVTPNVMTMEEKAE